MNYKNITEKLKRVAAIVDSWQHSDAIPQIERDIALGELRKVYDELLVLDGDTTLVPIDTEANTTDVEEDSASVEEGVDALEQTEEQSARDPFYDALDIDALLGLSDEPRDEQVHERACRRDDEPLPRGAAGHGVFLREAEAFHLVVVLAHAGHIAAEGQEREAVLGLAALHLPDFRAHADRKFSHQDSCFFGKIQMTKFMDNN